MNIMGTVLHSLILSNVRVESGVRGTLSRDSFLCGGNGTCCSCMGESCFGMMCPVAPLRIDRSLSASESSEAYIEFVASLIDLELRLPSDDGRG